LPGQEARGVDEVWPRTTDRAGAEPAAPGQATATSATSRQAAAAAAGARVLPLLVGAAV